MSSADPALALIDAFVRPDRRARLRGLLASRKGRAKLRAALAHFRDLEPRYARLMPASEQTAAGIAALLRARGAPATCYGAWPTRRARRRSNATFSSGLANDC